MCCALLVASRAAPVLFSQGGLAPLIVDRSARAAALDAAAAKIRDGVVGCSECCTGCIDLPDHLSNLLVAVSTLGPAFLAGTLHRLELWQVFTCPLQGLMPGVHD